MMAMVVVRLVPPLTVDELDSADASLILEPQDVLALAVVVGSDTSVDPDEELERELSEAEGEFEPEEELELELLVLLVITTESSMALVSLASTVPGLVVVELSVVWVWVALLLSPDVVVPLLLEVEAVELLPVEAVELLLVVEVADAALLAVEDAIETVLPSLVSVPSALTYVMSLRPEPTQPMMTVAGRRAQPVPEGQDPTPCTSPLAEYVPEHGVPATHCTDSSSTLTEYWPSGQTAYKRQDKSDSPEGEEGERDASRTDVSRDALKAHEGCAGHENSSRRPHALGLLRESCVYQRENRRHSGTESEGRTPMVSRAVCQSRRKRRNDGR